MSNLQRQQDKSLNFSRMSLSFAYPIVTIPVVVQTLWELLLHMTESKPAPHQSKSFCRIQQLQTGLLVS